MKKIGFVGGTSWTSTIDYYRYMNEGINARLGGLHFAECLLYSVNFNDYQESNADGNWNGTARLLSDAAKKLKSAGADAIVLCANTSHIVAEQVENEVGLPLINVITATAAAIREKKLKTVGLLGTSYTMKLDFYKDKLRSFGIEPLIPASAADLDFLQHTLRYELGSGIIKPATKAEYLRIIRDLEKRGAEGIILGCTEIPLLISQSDLAIPAFDTTRIHVQAAIDFALS